MADIMGAPRENLDYLLVLKALNEIPFGVGKKLLVEFLQGKLSNESIVRNKLDSCENFGSMVYEKCELMPLIDNLILNNLIQLSSVKGNQFWKVMELTKKGKEEINSPTLYKRKSSFGFKAIETKITEKDKSAFDALGPFLEKFDDFQKKSIICKNSKILCLAGAGSGKTSVLIKRIEFLVTYCSKNPDKILAITFTRKAREEMQNRIASSNNLGGVHVETFNSFCEKILKTNNDQIYSKPVRVLNYRDKILIFKQALEHIKVSMNTAIDFYFSLAQRRGKTDEQLAKILLNDIFFLRDYFKFKHLPIDESLFHIQTEQEKSLRMVLSICNYIETSMVKHGFRDFSDQLLDTLKLFEEHKNIIPKFDHILIDEYQDVNSTQIKLIDMMLPDNLFCVGDPRQSIYGWRGSDIRYILKFNEKYPESEIITLMKNYRSTKHIVELINYSIKSLGLPDLQTNETGGKDIELLKFDSENLEFEFIIQKILASNIPRNEIFVLARTNRQLNDFSQSLKLRRIKHAVRNIDSKKYMIALKDEVMLATIHSIKGMEAEMVFVIGCTNFNFPCKGSEHPVMDMVKILEYDKEEEEKRLFYVAMSRAKKTLYLTYSGKSHTYFITDNMLNILEQKEAEVKIGKPQKQISAGSNDLLTMLKNWRRDLSKQTNMPAYVIMHDRTLIDISIKAPITLLELEDIHGLGPVKIVKYGQQILDLVGLKN
jgi:DNA helicase II / ATP-dependent DNA helicase PcrA